MEKCILTDAQANDSYEPIVINYLKIFLNSGFTSLYHSDESHRAVTESTFIWNWNEALCT